MKYRICIAFLAAALSRERRRHRTPAAKARHEQDGRSSSPMPAICGPSAATAAWRRGLPRARAARAARPFRPMAPPWRFPAITTATPTCSPCPPAAACPSASPSIPRPIAWWAGVPTASRSCSAPIARPIRDTPSSSRCRPKAACRCSSAAAHGLRFVFPDMKRMAYQPLDGGQFATDTNNFVSWKRYRGGRASYIWIVNFADLKTEPIPRTDSNDFAPMWIGDKVYFLSDRNGPVTLFRYDPSSKKVDELIKNLEGYRVRHRRSGRHRLRAVRADPHLRHRHPEGTPGAIEMAADLTEVRPHFQNVSREIRDARISSTGVRAVFEAHGEILTASRGQGRHSRPDQHAGRDGTVARLVAGRQIDRLFLRRIGRVCAAHQVADRRGRYPQDRTGRPFGLLFEPAVVARQQARRLRRQSAHLWDVDVAAGKLTKVDTDYISEGGVDFAWSGDSKWIAYTKSLPNRLHA
jgi:hypothetical protein